MWDSDQAAMGSCRTAVLFYKTESEGWCRRFGVLDTRLGLFDLLYEDKGVNCIKPKAFTSLMEAKVWVSFLANPYTFIARACK